MNRLGQGRFRGFSAGSQPTGQENPLVRDLLEQQGMPLDGLRSKHGDEFARPGAPALEFVFTVCGNAAGEVCPVWPGQPMTAHRGSEEPAAVNGSDAEKREAVSSAYLLLNRHISFLISLPIQKLSGLSLQQQLDDIGRNQGLTEDKQG